MDLKNLSIERSDDRRRGTLPHLAKTISAVRGLASTRCYRCGLPASHLIDAMQAPRAVCGAHEREWRASSPAQRLEQRGRFAQRGIQ